MQPFDSKFMIDFLTGELFAGNGDLKFVSWDDFDKALESDTGLKKKLANISQDKEIAELKNLIYSTTDNDNEVYERPSTKPRKFYQKFIPYDASSMENDISYNNIVKRDGTNQLK